MWTRQSPSDRWELEDPAGAEDKHTARSLPS